MLQSYQLPIKGTFYYAAELAFDEELINDRTFLELRAEPENPYDSHALQILLPSPQHSSHNRSTLIDVLDTDNHGLLLGYVPRQLAPIICRQLKLPHKYSLQVAHKAKVGKRIEIECLLKIQLPWFTALNLRLLTLWVQQLKQLKRLQRYLSHTHE